jgi:hypothetical protein
LWVEQDVLDRIRKKLTATSTLYERMRQALNDPTGEAGHALAGVLDSILDGGVLGELLYGTW